jgi:hypothetical protein
MGEYIEDKKGEKYLDSYSEQFTTAPEMILRFKKINLKTIQLLGRRSLTNRYISRLVREGLTKS